MPQYRVAESALLRVFRVFRVDADSLEDAKCKGVDQSVEAHIKGGVDWDYETGDLVPGSLDQEVRLIEDRAPEPCDWVHLAIGRTEDHGDCAAWACRSREVAQRHLSEWLGLTDAGRTFAEWLAARESYAAGEVPPHWFDPETAESEVWEVPFE
jgi:hypothetical protein